MTCDKKRFLTRSAAKRAAKRYRAKGLTDGHVYRSYRCRKCKGYYHLTSERKRQEQAAEEAKKCLASP